MTIMVDIKQYKAHWESKHTKNGAFPGETFFSSLFFSSLSISGGLSQLPE